MNWVGTNPPPNPAIGDCYYDSALNCGRMWLSTGWHEIAGAGTAAPPKVFAPTEEELEKYPALKSAWEEYLVIRKLVGVGV